MILYFSGTGNSKYVAELIAQHTKDDVFSANDYIKDNIISDFHSEKPYIFVAPAYAWTFPEIFSEWLTMQKNFKGNRKVYFVITCASSIGNPEYALKSLSRKLNLQYMGVVPVVMPNNYIIIFDAPSKEEEEHIIASATKTSRNWLSYIDAEKPFPKLQTSFYDRIKSHVLGPIDNKVSMTAKGFYANDACIGCNMCEKICPLNNISMKESRPIWGKQCTQCMACIAHCPKEAIEFNNTTKGRRRYINTTNPCIKESELL